MRTANLASTMYTSLIFRHTSGRLPNLYLAWLTCEGLGRTIQKLQNCGRRTIPEWDARACVNLLKPNIQNDVYSA